MVLWNVTQRLCDKEGANANTAIKKDDRPHIQCKRLVTLCHQFYRALKCYAVVSSGLKRKTNDLVNLVSVVFL